ncbi:MAG: hypothetical protein J0L94_17025 [Rhodothermia bacterium]|nr:hypothetical protein [Rhodothermia bacterium]
MKLAVITTSSLVLHLVLGWMFAPLATFAGGFWQGSGGGRLGSAAMGLSWLGLMVWNYVVAPEAMQKMFVTMSGILGNLPAFGYPLLTLIFAVLLGGLSGYLGGQLAKLKEKIS